MKIIYVANARIPSEKAHPYQILKMCEAFAKNGIEMELIYPFRFNTKRMRSVKDIWRYYGIKTEFRLKRLISLDLLFFAPPISLIEYLAFLIQGVSFAISFLIYLLCKKTDIYYSRDPISILFLILLNRIQRKELYYEAHQFPKGKLSEKMHTYILREVNGIVVITERLKDLWVKRSVSSERILVAPDGVDLEMFSNNLSKREARERLNIPMDRRIICYTGHLYKWKGVYVLAESMKHLPEDTILYIVGGMDGDIAKLKQFITIKDILNVILVGYIPPRTIPQYLAAADILVLPNSGKERFSIDYTSPIKLFEYMASEKPIVASDLPAIREVLKTDENAILVEPDNPEALAQGIKRVLKDESLSRRISKKAYSQIARYTYDRRAQKIIQFIRGRDSRWRNS